MGRRLREGWRFEVAFGLVFGVAVFRSGFGGHVWIHVWGCVLGSVDNWQLRLDWCLGLYLVWSLGATIVSGLRVVFGLTFGAAFWGLRWG